MQPASAVAASTARWVAAAPNGAISIGSGKRPSIETHLVSSTITTIRAEAVATIFSRSKRAPSAFDQRQVGRRSRRRRRR